MLKLGLIAGGGALGALLRYGVSAVTKYVGDPSFPTGTLVVNVVGCLAIGLASGYFAGPHPVRDELRVAVLVGLLGAFTTFSTFGIETIHLLNDGQFAYAGLNIVLSNVGCLTAAWLGYRVAEQLYGV